MLKKHPVLKGCLNHLQVNAPLKMQTIYITALEFH